MMLALALVAMRPDIDLYPKGRLLSAIAIFTALVGVLATVQLRPLPAPPVSTRGFVLAIGALALPWVVALLPEAHLAHPAVFHDTNDCLLVGTMSGAALMVLLWMLDRSTSAARSLLLPAAAGGALANLALTFHCDILSPLHLAVIHAPVGILLLLGSQSIRAARLRTARERRA
jgi:hypothetical protein